MDRCAGKHIFIPLRRLPKGIFRFYIPLDVSSGSSVNYFGLFEWLEGCIRSSPSPLLIDEARILLLKLCELREVL
jgi:hypothetical protein